LDKGPETAFHECNGTLRLKCCRCDRDEAAIIIALQTTGIRKRSAPVAAKGGFEELTIALAKRLVPREIRGNPVVPGLTDL
jgi:NAD(P)-dependent dehydrogenase (short-subunit alcohol dehydrogenase family)